MSFHLVKRRGVHALPYFSLDLFFFLFRYGFHEHSTNPSTYPFFAKESRNVRSLRSVFSIEPRSAPRPFHYSFIHISKISPYNRMLLVWEVFTSR